MAVVLLTNRVYTLLPCAIDQVIIGGGGNYNPVLMEMLQAQLAPIPPSCAKRT